MTLIRRWLFCSLVILICLPALAQQPDINRYTLFTGFDYMISPARNLAQRGFETDFGITAKPWLGLGADFGILGDGIIAEPEPSAAAKRSMRRCYNRYRRRLVPSTRTPSTSLSNPKRTPLPPARSFICASGRGSRFLLAPALADSREGRYRIPADSGAAIPFTWSSGACQTSDRYEVVLRPGRGLRPQCISRRWRSVRGGLGEYAPVHQLANATAELHSFLLWPDFSMGPFERRLRRISVNENSASVGSPT